MKMLFAGLHECGWGAYGTCRLRTGERLLLARTGPTGPV